MKSELEVVQLRALAPRKIADKLSRKSVDILKEGWVSRF